MAGYNEDEDDIVTVFTLLVVVAFMSGVLYEGPCGLLVSSIIN